MAAPDGSVTFPVMAAVTSCATPGRNAAISARYEIAISTRTRVRNRQSLVSYTLDFSVEHLSVSIQLILGRPPSCPVQNGCTAVIEVRYRIERSYLQDFAAAVGRPAAAPAAPPPTALRPLGRSSPASSCFFRPSSFPAPALSVLDIVERRADRSRPVDSIRATARPTQRRTHCRSAAAARRASFSAHARMVARNAARSAGSVRAPPAPACAPARSPAAPHPRTDSDRTRLV